MWKPTAMYCLPTFGVGTGVTYVLQAGSPGPKVQLVPTSAGSSPVTPSRCQKKVPVFAYVARGVVTEIRDVAVRASRVTAVSALTVKSVMTMCVEPVFDEVECETSP